MPRSARRTRCGGRSGGPSGGRLDRLLLRPESLKGGAAQKVAGKLLSLGLVQEVQVQSGEPAWRTGEDGTCSGLRLTPAGIEAIGIEPDQGGTAEASSEPGGDPDEGPKPGPEGSGPRPGSKQALVLSLLARKEGATLDQLVAATGWLPHTTRAALTGLRQRGYTLVRNKDEAGRTVYRIEDSEGRVGKGASGRAA